MLIVIGLIALFIIVVLGSLYVWPNKTLIAVMQLKERQRYMCNFHHVNYVPNFKPKLEENYIQLSTTNSRVDQVNENKLKALKTDEKNYEGLVEGVFPPSFMRTQENLVLKIGAQIMTVINDSGRVPSDRICSKVSKAR